MDFITGFNSLRTWTLSVPIGSTFAVILLLSLGRSSMEELVSKSGGEPAWAPST
jgi:hypothetical protein